MRRMVVLTSALAFSSAFLGALATVALVVPAAVEAQETRIRAEVFTLIGPAGDARLQMQANTTATNLQMRDAAGSTQVAIGANQNQGGIALAVPNEPPTVALLMSPSLNGLAVNGVEQTEPRAVVGVSAAGAAGMAITDRAGNPRVLIQVAPDDTPMIQILDANRNVIWSAPEPASVAPAAGATAEGE